MMQMSKEYAEALFALACEENRSDEYGEALNTVSDVFEKNSEYIDLLSSPAIALNERLGLIESAFSSSLPEHIVSFLKLLCEKMRIRGFVECVSEYNKLLASTKRISTATVSSALELTSDEENALKKKLEKMCGHTVLIETIVDSSIIGGMIIEIDGKVIDASLRRRLSDVKDVISR